MRYTGDVRVEVSGPFKQDCTVNRRSKPSAQSSHLSSSEITQEMRRNSLIQLWPGHARRRQLVAVIRVRFLSMGRRKRYSQALCSITLVPLHELNLGGPFSWKIITEIFPGRRESRRRSQSHSIGLHTHKHTLIIINEQATNKNKPSRLAIHKINIPRFIATVTIS